jgi:hypothetical protein
VAVPVRADSAPAFQERYVVPVRAVLGVLVVVGFAAAELHGGAGGWRAVVPYVVLLPPAVLSLGLLSRGEGRVAEGVLHVPGARAPLSAFGPPEVLEGPSLRRVLGPEADPLAWVTVRPWHRAAVRLPVVDPEDDTPYWVVGSRRPLSLVEALS